MNPSFTEVTGYSLEEIKGKNARVLRSKQQTRAFYSSLWNTISSGGTWSGEICTRKKDGDSRWSTATISSMKDRDGRITNFVAALKDISREKQMHDQLAETAGRLQALYDHSPSSIHELDQQGRYLQINRYTEKLVGLPVENIIGKTMHDLFPSQRADELMQRIHRTITNRREESFEDVLDLPDREVHLHTTVFPIYSSQGNPPTAGIIAHDITQLKQSEEALKLFKTIFDQANYGSAVADMDGTLIQVNRSFAESHGYETDELIGQPLQKLHAPSQLTPVGDLLEMIRSRGSFPAQEVGHVRKDGTVFPMLMTGSLITDAQGEPSFFAVTTLDLTGYKQLEEQLFQAQKMESLGQMVGGIAHDFNNMLLVILGYAELALEEVEPESSLHSDLLEMQKAALQSKELVQHLLGFARKQKAEPKTLDTNKELRNMENMLKKAVGEHITLNMEQEKDLWSIRIDPSQMHQIMMNLCVNARDAVDDTGTITISTKNVVIEEQSGNIDPDLSPGSYVRVCVEDTGSGIDKSLMDKLFDPFFTTKGKGKGTGFGLATVYGIMKQNNGVITVSSKLGKGTVFSLYFPQDSEHQFHEKDSDAGSAPEDVQKRTLLVVDDNLLALQMTRRMLESGGFQVYAASSPSEALRLAEEYSDDISLVITDMVMPETDGLVLLKALRKHMPDIGCIIMSGYSDQAISDLDDPQVKAIQKPFEMKQLLKLVHSFSEDL